MTKRSATVASVYLGAKGALRIHSAVYELHSSALQLQVQIDVLSQRPRYRNARGTTAIELATRAFRVLIVVFAFISFVPRCITFVTKLSRAY